jgi:hypothetical protein
MRFLLLSIILLFLHVKDFAQQEQVTITQMTWGPDYQVYLKMANDSSYIYQINELFHADPEEVFSNKTEFVYYPVNFDRSYIDSLLNRNSQEEFTVSLPREPQIRKITLWGAMKESLEGGWVHFINCLVYSLETRQLELTAPLLKRPDSQWKPKPVTETYRRTKKWKYYVPVEQKYAQKEYRIRKKKNQLGDLKSIPQNYIDLFLNTSEKEYQLMLKKHEYSKLARIDLVKLMLGSSFLSEAQIDYIKSRVMLAIAKYNANRMPTVLIFDQYQAAVAMTMDEKGYRAQKIVYKDEEKLNYEEIDQRTQIIRGIIALINESNNKAFKEKLKGLYK